VAIYSTFLQRAYDQIVHDVCLQKLPVVFAIDRGGLVGEDGATHQGLLDYSYLRSIPNIVVMAPKDENELQHMLKTAVGKSTICSFFKEELGADVLSLDFISHELYELPEVSSALRNAFGTSVRREIAMKLTEDPSLWEDFG